MRKVKFLFLTIPLTLFLWSCKSNKSKDFLVENTSRFRIDSIKISASGTDYKAKQISTNLMVNDSIFINLNMSDVPRTDGNYLVELSYRDTIDNKAFGYYTNGNPTNSIYKLNIKDDTILISETMR